MGMDQYIFLEDTSMPKNSDDRMTEICYWRRFYRLHNFIMPETLNNIIRDEMGIYDAEITLEQLELIGQFITDPEMLNDEDIYTDDFYSDMESDAWEQMTDKWISAINDYSEWLRKIEGTEERKKYRLIYSANW